MHSEKHFRVDLPSFFSKNEIARLTRDPEFPFIREQIDSIESKCAELADEIREDMEDNLGLDPSNTPKEILLRIEALQNMSAELHLVSDTFNLFEFIMKDDTYVWDPPRGPQGQVLLNDEIVRPEMEKLDLIKHTLKHPKNQLERHEEEWPMGLLLYSGDSYRQLPEQMTVEELYAATKGETEDLNKYYIRDSLKKVRELYKDNATLYESTALQIDMVLAFFNKQKIKDICEANNQISMN